MASKLVKRLMKHLLLVGGSKEAWRSDSYTAVQPVSRVVAIEWRGDG
jgi:hypothetical protein